MVHQWYTNSTLIDTHLSHYISSIYISFLHSLLSVCHEHQFKDKYLFYRFHDDDQGIGVTPTNIDKRESDESLQDTLSLLAQIGPDAMMRMILRKP